jgi:hypothetical protein
MDFINYLTITNHEIFLLLIRGGSLVRAQEGDGNKEFDEIFLLRNQSKKGIGFFADGNNFYPDFVLWIKKEGKQYLTFIDPKGIRNSKGINDAKIQFFKYLEEKVQPQVANENLILNSFIILNTKWLEVNWKDSLTVKDFNKNHVYFQEDQNSEYIKLMLKGIVSK